VESIIPLKSFDNNTDKFLKALFGETEELNEKTLVAFEALVRWRFSYFFRLLQNKNKFDLDFP